MADRQDYRGLAISVAVGLVGITLALTLGRAVRPSAEDAELAHARRQRKGGDPVGALQTLMRCMHLVKPACGCAADGEELGVDINRYLEALHVLHGAEGCTSPRYTGGLAEALVATGNLVDGAAKADETLARAPDEPHACFAKAWALSAQGSSPQALDLAERAVRGGRGLPAMLVLANLRATAGDRAGARQVLERARSLAPDDTRVIYNLGVIEERDHHYREAREAFLHALALDPKLADARYELAALAHSVKADDEARHHLEELTKLAPDDPRVPELRAALDASKASPPPGTPAPLVLKP